MLRILILVLIFTGSFAQKKLLFQDCSYESTIKSVLLYPVKTNTEDPARTLNPAIKTLRDEQTPFVLEFDDLNARYEEFHVRLLHCTKDWKQSVIAEIEYMPNYNDFIISDFQVSANTKVNYYHYRFEVPNVKISGNYLLVVHRNNNKNDIILSKKMMVVENKLSIAAKVNYAQDPAKRRTHQQIDFDINYGNYALMSPKDELKVVVRQNFRDDKTIKNLKAFSVDAFSNQLGYHFFDNENTIEAGNEYRFFDARSAYSRGLFIGRIQNGKIDDLWVSPQSSRALMGYSELTDFDGMFINESLDNRNQPNATDYVYVTFGLKADDFGTGAKVYINGAFNNWELDKENLMEYETAFGGYVGTMQLKQGIYNYNFVVQEPNQKPNEFFFEGNFAETENTYEIIVYHRPLASRADVIVGYQLVEFNKKK